MAARFDELWIIERTSDQLPAAVGSTSERANSASRMPSLSVLADGNRAPALLAAAVPRRRSRIQAEVATPVWDRSARTSCCSAPSSRLGGATTSAARGRPNTLPTLRAASSLPPW